MYFPVFQNRLAADGKKKRKAILAAYITFPFSASDQSQYVQYGAGCQQCSPTDHSGMGGVKYGCDVFQLRDSVIIQQLA